MKKWGKPLPPDAVKGSIKPMKKVLLGENPENSDGSVRKLLEIQQTVIIPCGTGIDAVRKAHAQKPDLIILDTHLPRMNGYQCARLLKEDPHINATPILHISYSDNPLDRYWSKVCRADGFLTMPVNEGKWHEALEGLVFRKNPLGQTISHLNLISELNDQAILMMATSLLEQDLLRASILNEINRIDTWNLAPTDLIRALLTIIGSLYPFSSGAAMLISDHHSEVYLCREKTFEQERVDEINKLISDHLWEVHGILLKTDDTVPFYLNIPISSEGTAKTGEIYIHTKDERPVYSVLFFEDIPIAEMSRKEQELFGLTLDLVQGVLEKKILVRKSQELSVIDTATMGYSMSFFMEVLDREMASARRNQFGITLITLVTKNFDHIRKQLGSQEELELIQLMQNAILKTLRKTDIIARWENCNFALLLTHTPLEKAEIPKKRLEKNILAEIEMHMPQLDRFELVLGMCDMDMEKEETAESFFSRAMPKMNTPENTESKPVTLVTSKG